MVAVPTDGGVSYPGGTTTYNSTVLYSCDAGFVVSGTGQRVCQANGQWSGPAETCEGMNVECQLLVFQ